MRKSNYTKEFKESTIKSSHAEKIIDDCIKATETFEQKALEQELDEITIKDSLMDINSQIKLLRK